MSSSGPNYASSCTDGGGGVFSWANLSDGTGPDAAYATSSSNNSQYTNFLTWTGFGFAIPSGATINGIVLEVARLASSTLVTDNEVVLVKGGSRGATNRANGTGIGATASIATYGSSSDLWGTSWTYSDINASNFGAAWTAVTASFSTKTVSVDYARITVYYTASGTSVTVSVTALGGSGTISDGFVVITDSVFTVGPLIGSGTLVDPGQSVEPLVGYGTLSPVNILVPPNLFINPLPLAAAGVLSGVVVGTGRTMAVSPLAATGVLSAVSVVTNGNVTVNVVALDSVGRLGTPNVWLNGTSTLVYSVYVNDGLGGGINYSSPLYSTQSLTYTSGYLAFPGDWKFGVRVSDLATSLEEKNIDAAFRLILDSSGVDVTNRPLAPVGLRVLPTAGGGCRAEWTCLYSDRAKRPTGFHVYSGPVGAVDYGTIKATKLYSGPGNYSVDIPGFTHGTEYSVGVRAYNASEELNTATTSFTADSVGPTAVHSLSASAV